MLIEFLQGLCETQQHLRLRELHTYSFFSIHKADTRHLVKFLRLTLYMSGHLMLSLMHFIPSSFFILNKRRFFFSSPISQSLRFMTVIPIKLFYKRHLTCRNNRPKVLKMKPNNLFYHIPAL